MAAATDDRVERRRAEIVRAATRVFAQKGYHDTNVADIASELKIGHGTIYRYYKNKLDLFGAVVQLAIEKVIEVVAHEVPDATRTIDEYHEQLHRLGEALLALVLRERELATVFFTESSSDREVAKTIHRAFHHCARFTQFYLENGVSRGFLRHDLDTLVTAKVINAMVFEALRSAAITQDEERSPPIDAWIAAVSDLVVRGIRR